MSNNQSIELNTEEALAQVLEQTGSFHNCRSTESKRFNERNGRGRNGQGRVYYNADKLFVRPKQELGVVLTLPSKGFIVKRVLFDKIQDILVTYVIKTFTDAATSKVMEAIKIN